MAKYHGKYSSYPTSLNSVCKAKRKNNLAEKQVTNIGRD